MTAARKSPARLRFSENVARSIQNLDEHWDGGGLPHGLTGEDIPVYSRIALMAQVIDVFQTANGVEAAKREIEHRTGTWFDPRLTEAFARIAERPEFWTALRSDDIESAVFALEPAQENSYVDEGYLDDIAAAFAQIIDSKSPYTSGHSERVTLFADLIAEQLEFSAEQRRWLKRAALLHDIGKLGVSNSILDKPAKLDADEWASMQTHAALGEAILSRIAALGDLAEIAGAHHERLDGKGYPRGLAGDQIPLEIRIVTTADIFDALTANRPYRAAMPVSQALTIMTDMVGRGDRRRPLRSASARPETRRSRHCGVTLRVLDGETAAIRYSSAHGVFGVAHKDPMKFQIWTALCSRLFTALIAGAADRIRRLWRKAASSASSSARRPAARSTLTPA